MKHPLRTQSGATLIVALIMLVLITMLAVTSFNLGKNDLQIVGNMQHRAEAVAAAEEAIEQALSNTNFFNAPDAVFSAPCQGVANRYCIDKDNDGTPEVVVDLTPAPNCIMAVAVQNKALNLNDNEDLGCALGEIQNFGMEGAVTGNSQCADSTWEIHAVATDTVTQSKVEMTQGTSVRVSTDNMNDSCT
jgi:Tfp pilus assembly protein PilV